MGVGGAGRDTGGNRVHPLRGILRYFHDRQFAARGAGIVWGRRVDVCHRVVADSILRRRRGDCVGVPAAFLGGASPRPDRADHLQFDICRRSRHYAGRLAREHARFCADSVRGLRDWRLEHIVRQGWRGIGSVELCDRHIGQMGQGIERHLAGGKVEDWLGYFLLHASFVLGAAAGGAISMVVTGPQMLAVAAVVCAATTGYTYLHADRRGLVNQKRPQPGKRLFRALRRGELDSGTSTPATNYGSS